MRQENYDNEKQGYPKEQYRGIFDGRSQSYGGFDFNFAPKSTWDDTEEERKAFYQQLWEHGDFHFWLATYQDMLFEDRANTEAYNFW
jgi:hypothetical protein